MMAFYEVLTATPPSCFGFVYIYSKDSSGNVKKLKNFQRPLTKVFVLVNEADKKHFVTNTNVESYDEVLIEDEIASLITKNIPYGNQVLSPEEQGKLSAWEEKLNKKYGLVGLLVDAHIAIAPPIVIDSLMIKIICNVITELRKGGEEGTPIMKNALDSLPEDMRKFMIETHDESTVEEYVKEHTKIIELYEIWHLTMHTINARTDKIYLLSEESVPSRIRAYTGEVDTADADAEEIVIRPKADDTDWNELFETIHENWTSGKWLCTSIEDNNDFHIRFTNERPKVNGHEIAVGK